MKVRLKGRNRLADQLPTNYAAWIYKLLDFSRQPSKRQWRSRTLHQGSKGQASSRWIRWISLRPILNPRVFMFMFHVMKDNPHDHVPEGKLRVVTPESIRPLPRISAEVRKTGGNKRQSMILTSSHEKAKIEEKSWKLPDSEVRRHTRFAKSRFRQGEEAGTSGFNAQKNDSSDDELNNSGQIEGVEELDQMIWLTTLDKWQTPTCIAICEAYVIKFCQKRCPGEEMSGQSL